MRKALIILLLLLCQSIIAMNPPAIVWVKYFFEDTLGRFYDARETSDGGLIVAGWHLLENGSGAQICLYKFDSNGNISWTAGAEGYSDAGQAGFWVEELTDSSFIVTGTCGIPDEPTSAVMLVKLDHDGNQIWARAYDAPGTNDQGNCVLPLDDGYAIAGDRGNEAWIIRTDLQGDSLWSVRISDYYYLNARRILLVDDALVTYITGVNPRIVALSVDDGQLLWETNDFPVSYPSYDDDYGDMTYSTTDNGFTFVTAYYPNIVHTDESGNVLWYYEVSYWSQPFSSSINNTMDGGYIYGGINTEQPDVPGSIYAGMVVKFDSEGNEHWRDYVYECVDLFSMRQLSSGGYIACGAQGNMGTLLRYAPETGIEKEGRADGVSITALSPNPFSSVLEIRFSLPECSQVDLGVYDLSGRLINTVEHEVFPAGEHSALWVPEGISSGCYIVRLSTPESSIAERCVFIE